MASLLRTIQKNVPRCSRALATTATPPSSTPRSKFSQELDSGPSLDDFIAGDVPDRIVLGNTKGCVFSLLLIDNFSLSNSGPGCPHF